MSGSGKGLEVISFEEIFFRDSLADAVINNVFGCSPLRSSAPPCFKVKCSSNSAVQQRTCSVSPDSSSVLRVQHEEARCSDRSNQRTACGRRAATAHSTLPLLSIIPDQRCSVNLVETNLHRRRRRDCRTLCTASFRGAAASICPESLSETIGDADLFANLDQFSLLFLEAFVCVHPDSL